MRDFSPFFSSRRFYGEQHFHYGLDRSGEFSIQQAELLMNHGWTYQALAEGLRSPGSPEEERFVAVCSGEKNAETDHEKVWMRYCTKVSPLNRGRKSAAI